MKMDMSSEFPEEDIFATFPCLCFPDVEDMELRIDEEEKALHITGTDSEWPLDGDLVLAAGAGCMSFFYSGDLRFEVEGPEGTRSIAHERSPAKGLAASERHTPHQARAALGAHVQCRQTSPHEDRCRHHGCFMDPGGMGPGGG